MGRGGWCLVELFETCGDRFNGSVTVMKNSAVVLLLLFAFPLVSDGQELDWERWGAGLGQDEIVRVGDTLYSTGTYKAGIGSRPRGTITRHDISPGDTSHVTITDIYDGLRGIAWDGTGFFWGLSLSADLYRINPLSGGSQLVATAEKYGSHLSALVRSNRGKLYYMNPDLVEIDPDAGTYQTLSALNHGGDVTVRPLGLSTLSDGGVAAVVHVKTEIIHEFSVDVLDTMAIMFVRSDGSFRDPMILPRDGFRIEGILSMHDMPNGDLLISALTYEVIEEGNVSYYVPRIILYRFDITGKMVAKHVWKALDRLWDINDMAITENGELIGVGSRYRGNHGTSSLMFRADFEGNILWSRDDVDFLYGVAQLDKVFRWKDGRFLVSGTTRYIHPDGNYYGSWLGLFNEDGESEVALDKEKELLLNLQ